jgi:hypothetical protein
MCPNQGIKAEHSQRAQKFYWPEEIIRRLEAQDGGAFAQAGVYCQRKRGTLVARKRLEEAAL